MGIPSAQIVVNPASSAGKTGKKQEAIVAEIGRRLKRPYSLCVTKGPLEATSATSAAIQRGSELIIAVGGDGTIQEVINGFFLNGKMINPSCQLGIVCSGTAQDVAKSFAMPARLEDQIADVCGDESCEVDLGRVAYRQNDGHESERFFINECQQGIAAVVVERVQHQHKKLGGFLGFALAAVATAARHREQMMTVQVDDREPIRDFFLGVVSANGAFAGGGMKFAPRARVDDGLLDVVLIHKQWIPARLWNFPKIYVGKHVDLSWVSYFQARRILVSSDERVPVEADGELLGVAPCAIEVLPRVLRLKSSSKRSSGAIYPAA
jgi:YegS/Rv2252/BmrU family lipid kinase